ncbi:protein methyltransferase [Aureococcus anophagefferens]|nr:protein methyltransferase [Aureococcus anophagefferens]
MAAQLDASDAALDGFVPSLDHASFADWDAVYEPAEDTFLLLDALFAERSSLRALGDATVVEVGPGSGVVSAYVAALLAAQAPRVVCVDVNPRACALSARTAAANGARVDVVRGDLATRVRRRPSAARKASRGARRCLARGSVDVLVFNPPNVPTPRAEVGGAGIEASWAGGDRGREVLDRLLPDVTRALSPRGRFYVVVVEENDPDDIARILAADGLERTTVATKRVGPPGARAAATGRPRRQRAPVDPAVRAARLVSARVRIRKGAAGARGELGRDMRRGPAKDVEGQTAADDDDSQEKSDKSESACFQVAVVAFLVVMVGAALYVSQSEPQSQQHAWLSTDGVLRKGAHDAAVAAAEEARRAAARTTSGEGADARAAPAAGVAREGRVQDDPQWLDLKQPRPMKRGYLAFAGSGPDSRTTEFFFTYRDTGLGRSPWEVPFGKVVGAASYAALDRFYSGYGDMAAFGGHAPESGKIRNRGAAYLDAEFPLLDFITRCDSGARPFD